MTKLRVNIKLSIHFHTMFLGFPSQHIKTSNIIKIHFFKISSHPSAEQWATFLCVFLSMVFKSPTVLLNSVLVTILSIDQIKGLS